MKHATIKDIARNLDLSTSTVSRALSDHPDISRETKDRVQAVAREMDYHPNTIAKSLQQKQSMIIGVVVPQVKHYFFASIMAGITDVAYHAGYTVMICQSNEDVQRETSNINVLISHRVAGLLISVSSTTTNTDQFSRFKKGGIPLVFFDRICTGVDVSTVVVDDYDGAFHATEYLIGKGHKCIGHLGGPETLSIARLRYEGYRDALGKNGMSFCEDRVVRGGLNEEDGTESATRLLEKAQVKPDALFCVNDPVAMGAMIALKKKGYRIPDDIAVVGFTDNPMAEIMEPPLTTVRQPAYEIGKTAAELLLDQIQDTSHRAQPVHKVLKTELIIRKSA
jgi:DNA-binding LacI/PurR family transcriptional regulator